jgi:thymidylate kinase
LKNSKNTTVTKILISGTFSTGKTTLARALTRELRERHVEVSLTSETARYCPYPLNKNQSFETSLWLTTEQMRREIEMTIEKPNIVICDRGIPDILSHALTISVKSKEDAKALETIRKIMILWAPTYNHIFWAKINPEKSILEDELRVLDTRYQSQLEQSIIKVFEELNINPFILPDKTIDRLDLIISELSRNDLIRSQNV